MSKAAISFSSRPRQRPGYWVLGGVAIVEAASAAALQALRLAVFSGAGALIVIPDGVFYNYRRDIVRLVNEARLPAIYPEREYADDGGLMAYGANVGRTTSGERRTMSIAS